ncbi:VOC family protein [Streptomyces yaizuensis]|uniref:VOC family protein n=1 Tax=Streptomyces yaizuensis TaxID=2989713 RepID=A0ABQ5P7Y4_9ACTN|nr:VOC family protein [Streptomyces sp. YSPA8]GLF98682.1 VOC family protein [Streptomyces sp. YSPA8]
MERAPSICPSLLYEDAKAAIRQLTGAFGFTEHAVYEDGDGLVVHAELRHGDGLVMLGSKGTGGEYDKALGAGGPAGVFVHVEDVDAHHRRAVEHGVEVLSPPTDQEYGAREYLARDLEGHVWSFGDYIPQGFRGSREG